MPYCEACGQRAVEDQNFCEECGARLRQEEVAVADWATAGRCVGSIPGETQTRKVQVSQLLAGAWVLGSIVLEWLSTSPGAWALLLAPTWIGVILPLIRSSNLTFRVERWEERLVVGYARATGKTGKFARYFTKPLYGGSLFIWRKTQPVGDAHLRAGIRVAALLYFATLMISLMVFVGYIIIAIVVGIAIILFAIWALSRGLTENLERESRGSSHYGGDLQRRLKLSRSATDFLGQPKMEHFDEHGRKIAETRPGRDFIGSPIEEHFDHTGRKIGESRPTTDFLGDPKTEHFDGSGQKTGESRTTTDFLGSPKVEHFDERGKKTGESRPDKDILGDSVIRHEEEE
jgi:hypothetical protein